LPDALLICCTVIEFGKRHNSIQQPQRTFAPANLLRTCYGETDVVMDFDLNGLSPLAPVHTGDYSRRFRRQFVTKNGDCRRTPNLATVAVFGDSVDKALLRCIVKPHCSHSQTKPHAPFRFTMVRYLSGQVYCMSAGEERDRL